MEPQVNQQALQPDHVAENQHATIRQDIPSRDTPTILSASGLSSWARNLVISHPTGQESTQPGNTGISTFSRFTSGLSFNRSPRSSKPDENTNDNEASPQSGVIGSFTKGLMDSSKNAVKAVQVKARHIVSQNKRRYQEGGYDLDMTYITENIIAMGFPAGDMSSGFFGYVEGFYRNHMEEVIKFFESHHKGKYKVYNLCSERLYDASLFEGKVACFPFDDHNCPPMQLIISFCHSAYSWLKEDIENVVVVHCKAGMARTGLMISSLLLYLKFFPTAEESMEYYNQKRCVDGKGLVLPSQIRYVKYFERILTYFNGENQPGRRCMFRGFRLHKCPYWIRPSITISDHNGILFSTKKHPRTKNLMPEDFWFSAPKKGIMVFALPGEPGLTEVVGDFKIHFHDRQGDFYCWLNTTMTENRKILTTSDLDGFDKRKLPSPGFQVEVVLADFDGSIPAKSLGGGSSKGGSDGSTVAGSPPDEQTVTTPSEPPAPDSSKRRGTQDEDDVFSESEAEESVSSRNRHSQVPPAVAGGIHVAAEAKSSSENRSGISGDSQQQDTQKRSDAAVTTVAKDKTKEGTSDISVFDAPKVVSTGDSEFKAIAADTSVFTFGDEDEYESE